MALSRRHFLASSAAAAGFGGLATWAGAQDSSPGYANEVFGYGALIPDPRGVLDLPQGFSYRVISIAGDRMSDGLIVPANADGMGCFDAGGGRVVLIRNHENRPENSDGGAFGPDGALARGFDVSHGYDVLKSGLPCPGGTTRMLYDLRAGKLLDQHLSLAGTLTNCAGGVTPRNSWLTCEETLDTDSGGKSHGWVFEVPAAGKGLADPVPLTGLGRFVHEAAATDPGSGVVYLTEDQQDGLFYRFLPHDRDDLRRDGRLQALGLRDGPTDTRNWTSAEWRPGDRFDAVWLDMDGVDNPHGDLKQRGHAKGAAVFARGEGLFFGAGAVFLACTSGGPAKLGQVFRYVPSPREGHPDEPSAPGRIELFVEPRSASLMRMPDNVAVTPWGHLIACEDQSGGSANHLRGITSGGKLYTLARNAKSKGEFAGACFSPDGSTMFVNLQGDGLTLAVTGPWGTVRA